MCVVFRFIFIITSRDKKLHNVNLCFDDDTTHVSCNKNKIKLFSLVSFFMSVAVKFMPFNYELRKKRNIVYSLHTFIPIYLISV